MQTAKGQRTNRRSARSAKGGEGPGWTTVLNVRIHVRQAAARAEQRGPTGRTGSFSVPVLPRTFKRTRLGLEAKNDENPILSAVEFRALSAAYSFIRFARNAGDPRVATR